MALQPAVGNPFGERRRRSLALLEAGVGGIACDRSRWWAEACGWPPSQAGSFSRANFADLAARLQGFGVTELDGILLDLGNASHPETLSRGFSFVGDGLLDMRMGPHVQRTAADILNRCSQEELEQIFFEYGEEPAARRLAAHLVKVRARAPIERTQDLVRAVESIIPKRGAKNPATKVFQALRIAVNAELSVLERALHELSPLIKPGGRMAVITFHSLEDRIVKRYFREVSQELIDRPEWPAPRRNPRRAFRLITSRPIKPSEEEVGQNSRARSAKLRVIEGISHES